MSNVVMSKEDLRQAQKVMLYIMKAIHRVCVKHNIKYWLDYGTLLGAIRHQGFIPWDDDMDICMMREDYDRFCEIAPKELGEEFFLQNSKTDRKFVRQFARVRLNGTVWLDPNTAQEKSSHKGFFVDVFPMDSMPQSLLARKWIAFFYDRVLNNIFHYKVFHGQDKNLFVKSLKNCAYFFFPIALARFLQKRKIRQLQQYKEKSPYVSKICMDCGRDICEVGFFKELILVPFEEVEFYVPKAYDKRLKHLFKDYMQLPPEGQRYGHHNVMAYNFGKYQNL